MTGGLPIAIPGAGQRSGNGNDRGGWRQGEGSLPRHVHGTPEASRLKLVSIGLACVVAVAAAILGHAATRPGTFRVQRTASVKSAPGKVFAHIHDFHNWSAWSPYEKLDPDMKRTFGGAASGEGAVHAWEGNAKAGKGRMEITAVSAPTAIAIQLDFEKPFQAHNVAEFTLVPNGELTEVTWAMRGPNLFVGKVISIFLDMDHLTGKDFETGLANLKALAEQPPNRR